MDDNIRKMSTERFLQMVYELYFTAGKQFCFILGAGASKTSGIRTATELMSIWLEDLRALSPELVKEAAVANNIGDWKRFLDNDYNVNSNDYFSIFALRFADMPAVAYKILEREMTIDNMAEPGGEKTWKFPSYGYLSLACFLVDSNNKNVITTNFDPMLEEALSVCRGIRPLVIGHETLAQFLDSNMDRPVIAKVHRDLLYQPMNTSQEMKELKEQWKDPLRKILTNNIPIVLGYAGADDTLMKFLENLHLDEIFWCDVSENPSDRVYNLLKETERGHWIKIDGFDEVAYRLVQKFRNNADYARRYVDPTDYIQSRSDKLLDLYKNERAKLSQNLGNSISATEFDRSKMKSDGDRLTETAENSAELVAKGEAYKSLRVAEDIRQEDIGEREFDVTDLYIDVLVAYLQEQYDDALDKINRIIEKESNEPRYLELRGDILHEMGRYEEALKDCDRVVELEPENASYLNSRGITLHAMGRYEEALKDKTKAVELEPENAIYLNSRGITLHEMGRYEEALKDKTKAVELEPENAIYWDGRGVTLHEMGRYEEALKDKTKAVELEPENASYLNSRGVTLHEMGRYEEALKDTTKAVELEPENASYWDNRGVILHKMGRYEEALKDNTKAVEDEEKI